MMSVRAQTARDRILIDQEMFGEDLLITGTILITLNHRCLERKRDLGIGNDQRKQECMRMTAGLTEAPCDSKHKDRIPLSKFPEITSIPDQAAAMTAGTGKQG